MSFTPQRYFYHNTQTYICICVSIIGVVITAGFGASMGVILYEIYNKQDYLWWGMLLATALITVINFISIIFIINIWYNHIRGPRRNWFNV
jgi:uncharacterized membrane protein YcjF (UPF0283 family)